LAVFAQAGLEQATRDTGHSAIRHAGGEHEPAKMLSNLGVKPIVATFQISRRKGRICDVM